MISTEATAETSRSRSQSPRPPYLRGGAGAGLGPVAGAGFNGSGRRCNWGRRNRWEPGLHLLLDYLRAAEASGRAEDAGSVGFSSGLGWLAAGTRAGALARRPTLARFSSSSRSGRCRIISTWVPLSILTSAPRVKSDTRPTAATQPQCQPRLRQGDARPQSADRANRSPGGNGDFGRLAGIASLVRVLFDGSLAVVLDRLLLRAGKAVHNARNLHHRAVGKDDRGKVHVQLRSALHTPARATRSTTPCT
jgi:hypothetical protein